MREHDMILEKVVKELEELFELVRPHKLFHPRRSLHAITPEISAWECSSLTIAEHIL
jgi:hypothetical protein